MQQQYFKEQLEQLKQYENLIDEKDNYLFLDKILNFLFKIQTQNDLFDVKQNNQIYTNLQIWGQNEEVVNLFERIFGQTKEEWYFKLKDDQSKLMFIFHLNKLKNKTRKQGESKKAEEKGFLKDEMNLNLQILESIWELQFDDQKILIQYNSIKSRKYQIKEMLTQISLQIIRKLGIKLDSNQQKDFELMILDRGLQMLYILMFLLIFLFLLMKKKTN